MVRLPRCLASALPLCAVLMGLITPGASASSVSISTGTSGTTVSYQAAPNETNVISVSLTGTTYTIEDPNNVITDNGGTACTVAPGGHTATCTATAGFSATLGNLNDQVTVLTATPLGAISGEEGSDKVFGGPGVENVDGGLGNDEIRGGGGNDVIDGNGDPTGGPDDDILDGGNGNDRFETGVPPGGEPSRFSRTRRR